MGTNRNKYTIIFALPLKSRVNWVSQLIAKKLTKRYGGCTLTDAKGYWAKDGQEFKEDYGAIMIEPASKIEVVTQGEASADIQDIVRNAMINLGCKGEWVHFEHIELNCKHFKI